MFVLIPVMRCWPPRLWRVQVLHAALHLRDVPGLRVRLTVVFTTALLLLSCGCSCVNEAMRFQTLPQSI